MAFDSHGNLAVSTVALPPSPALSGTTLTLAATEGARFPATPFNAVVCPGNASPTPANAEIVRVTGRSGDVLTIVRAQEGTSARVISVGDRIFDAITAKTLTDIEVNMTGVTPESQGAVGDGVALDSTALAAALATGKAVSLTPGKTYLCRNQLNITTPGQVIHGNGATIKAPAQAVTTTTTSITSGVTNQITVADASGFRVGDSIVVEQGGTFDPASRTISSIVGNVITVSGTFGVTLTGTINVRYALSLLVVSAANVRITGVILDGNKSNWTWGRWQHTAAIYGNTASEKNLEVDHCTVQNWYGDGIDPAGPGAVVAFNWIENIAGRGIVFSGLAGSPTNIGTRCLGNHVLTCNTDTAVAGNDGAASIDFSQGGPNTLIHGNYVKSGSVGIRSATAQNNYGFNVIANEIHNMTSNGVEVNVADASSVVAGAITIRDNEFETIGGKGITVRADGSLTTVLKRLTIENNELRSVTGEGIEVGSVTSGKILSEVKIANNTVYAASGSSSEGVLIHIFRVNNANIHDNACIGGVRGIYLTAAGSVIDIHDNVCSGQYTSGIECNQTSFTGLQIHDNRVISDPTADSANYYAILASSGDLKDNQVDTSAATVANAIGVQGSNQVVQGNHVLAASGDYSIFVIAGTNNIIQNNICNTEIHDSGTGTRRTGNRITNGASALSGVATLVAGTVTVATAEIKTGDPVILVRQAIGGTAGNLSLGTIIDATSFVINSSSGTDTSTVFWRIEH